MVTFETVQLGISLFWFLGVLWLDNIAFKRARKPIHNVEWKNIQCRGCASHLLAAKHRARSGPHSGTLGLGLPDSVSRSYLEH